MHPEERCSTRENGQFLDLPKHLVGPSAARSSDLPRRQLEAPLRITGNSEVMIQDRLLAGLKSVSRRSPLISSKPVFGQRSFQRGGQHEAPF
jgi:hypothetical protein